MKVHFLFHSIIPLTQKMKPANHSVSSHPLGFLAFFIACIFIFILGALVVSTLVSVSTSYDSFVASPSPTWTPTTIEHIVFGIASNNRSWPERRDFIRLWWDGFRMRGCVFLDEALGSDTNNTLDSNSLPPICISGDTSRFRYTYKNGLRSAIRIARLVKETVDLNLPDVRWYVFGDDDTVFVPENLVKTLSKYNHKLWYYIGANSEVYEQNKFHSFGMAFGGGGFAISSSLAKVLSNVLDSCIERYPHLYGSDSRIASCVAELGVGLTQEPGFHQMDVRGDVSGLLGSHPLTPLVSLHHLEEVDPIFPNMSRHGAISHLFHAVKADPGRVMQQTVCYDHWFSWTVSVSWGYAVQVHDHNVLLRDALRVQRTFSTWKKGINELTNALMFDSAPLHTNLCRRPTIFFLDRVDEGTRGLSRSSYRRMVVDNCSYDPMLSPKKLREVQVFAPKSNVGMDQIQAPRRQCCDVLPPSVDGRMDISVRECNEEELIYMHP